MSNNLNISDIGRIFKGLKPGAIGTYRYYSVLIPLVEKDGEPHLLYEVRAESLKRQPGEICFPGGALEPGENRRQCAVRETKEELGIRTKDIKVLAETDALYTYSNFTMFCYVGQISYDVVCNAKINEEEVKEVFLVPLKFFIETEPYIYNVDIIPDVGDDFPYDMIKFANGYNWRKGKSEVPIYRFEDRIIWGLTARITHNLAKKIRASK